MHGDWLWDNLVYFHGKLLIWLLTLPQQHALYSGYEPSCYAIWYSTLDISCVALTWRILLESRVTLFEPEWSTIAVTKRPDGQSHELIAIKQGYPDGAFLYRTMSHLCAKLLPRFYRASYELSQRLCDEEVCIIYSNISNTQLPAITSSQETVMPWGQNSVPLRSLSQEIPIPKPCIWLIDLLTEKYRSPLAYCRPGNLFTTWT